MNYDKRAGMMPANVYDELLAPIEPWAPPGSPLGTSIPPIQYDPAHGAGAQHEAVSRVVVYANLGVTLIIVVAMAIDGAQIGRAILTAAIYFILSTVSFALITTGTAQGVINQWQHERTERARVAAYMSLGELMVELKMLQEVRPPMAAQGLQGARRLSPLGDHSANYVAPYLDGQEAAVEGLQWASRLYAVGGSPDTKKVHYDGRLKIRMIGSKRGGGSRESGLYLLRQGVIVRVGGGYALNLSRYPSVGSVRALLG